MIGIARNARTCRLPLRHLIVEVPVPGSRSVLVTHPDAAHGFAAFQAGRRINELKPLLEEAAVRNVVFFVWMVGGFGSVEMASE